MNLDNRPVTSRRHLAAHDLDHLYRGVCGGPRRVRDAVRLTGGTAKGVYRLRLDDDSTVVAYVWSRDEDYWDRTDPSVDSGATGGHRFAAAHAAFSEAGARVAAVLGMDLALTDRDAEVAVLEDLRGGSLEAALAAGGAGPEAALVALAAMVRRMHGHRTERFGPPTSPLPGAPSAAPIASTPAPKPAPTPDPTPAPTTTPRTGPLEAQVTENALRDLAFAATREPRLAAVEHSIAETLEQRLDAVRPRSSFGLLHGELGPDHVLLDGTGAPVLIDIETAAYEDAEREHAFLELRFGPNYRVFDTTALDPDRLRLYRLARYLDLVAGPLRLLDGDFPDRAFMLDVVEQNVRRTLGQLTSRAW